MPEDKPHTGVASANPVTRTNKGERMGANANSTRKHTAAITRDEAPANGEHAHARGRSSTTGSSHVFNTRNETPGIHKPAREIPADGGRIPADDTKQLADDILFLNEYEYENDLLTEFARLQVTDGVRCGLLVGGVALAAAGAAWLFSPNAFGWIGIFLVLIGVFLVWYRTQMFHVLAKRYIDAMESGEGSLSGRWRRVAANNDGLMVFAADGRSHYFPFSNLKRFRVSDLLIVAEFGDEGVAVPAQTFIRGNAEDFAQFLYEKRYGR